MIVPLGTSEEGEERLIIQEAGLVSVVNSQENNPCKNTLTASCTVMLTHFQFREISHVFVASPCGVQVSEMNKINGKVIS